MKGYELWCPETRKTVVSIDVVFDILVTVCSSPHWDFDKTEEQTYSTQVELKIVSGEQSEVSKQSTD